MKATTIKRSPGFKYTSTEILAQPNLSRLSCPTSWDKEAKGKKEVFKPVGGMMTHSSLMATFNARFTGKFVDGYEAPRPAREQHSFGLWSAK